MKTRAPGPPSRPALGSGESVGPRRADVAWSLVLVLLVAAGWGVGVGLQRWSLPLSSPTDGFRGDLLFHLALVRASMEGDFPPVLWKTVPSLGAPDGAQWNDWPVVEELPTLCMAMIGRIVGLVAGYNVSLLTSCLLASLTFFTVARASGCARPWSFVGGLAFGLAPCTFAQTPHHPFIAQAWHVPLFLPIWRWVTTGDGIVWRSRPFWFAVGVGAVTGLQSPYYTNIFCQVTLLGGLVTFARNRTGLASAAAVVTAAAAAFALMNVDTWTYRLVHGANPGALVREYKWLEIYGLKIVDLLIPPPTHRIPAFAAFATAHRAVAPLQDEGSYLGVVGIAALLLLVGTAVAAVVRRRDEGVPIEAWWVLWIVLVFSTGGLNAVLGACGLTLFRTGCRYAVVILAIVLLFAARRLTAWEDRAPPDASSAETRRIGILTAVAALTTLVLIDQVPRSPGPEQVALIARQEAADRDFVARMGAALPARASVFQLPVMDFPEAPLPSIPAYDHLRPFVQGGDLRYSFGSTKGRPQDQWQREIEQQLLAAATPNQEARRLDFDPAAVRRVVAALRERGFSAIYLNRNGFPDLGRGLQLALRDAGCDADAIESRTGDLVCIVLPAS